MKFKNIITFFTIALCTSVVVRTLQVLFMTDATTGFFTGGYRVLGFKMLMVILAACGVTAILSFTCHRSPVKPPKVNILLGLSSMLLGISIGYEIYSQTFVSAIRMWQIASLDVAGVLCAVMFIAYGMKAFIKFDIPKLVYIIAPVYWILRLICIFTTISSLSLIIDNLFVLAVYSVTLLFMVNFAKLFNGIDEEYNFRKLLASGLTSIILCACLTFPRAFAILSGKSQVLHNSVGSTVTVLFTGIFVTVFIFSHFAAKNLKVKKRHRSKAVFMKDDGKNDSFYVTSGQPTEKPY